MSRYTVWLCAADSVSLQAIAISKHMDNVYFDDSQRSSWNAYVSGSRHGHILQSWEWGEVKSRTGWEPIRLALVDNGEIRAAAQILIRALPYGLGKLAYVPKGPVVDYSDRAALVAMRDALLTIAAQHNLISVKIEPEVVAPSPATGELRELGLEVAPPVQMRSTIWVDLAPSEDEIMARQKQKMRYNIRLASKRGVTVREAGTVDLERWFEMYRITAARDGFSTHDLNYYRTVLDVLRPEGMATLLLAEHVDQLLAGIVVFRFGRLAQYMYGASSNEKRNLQAPSLVQWEGMRWARSGGAQVYDLWGIPDTIEEGEDLYGVYKHKLGYGGAIVRYIGAFDLVRSSLQHLALERVARPFFKKVARLTA